MRLFQLLANKQADKQAELKSFLTSSNTSISQQQTKYAKQFAQAVRTATTSANAIWLPIKPTSAVGWASQCLGKFKLEQLQARSKQLQHKLWRRKHSNKSNNWGQQNQHINALKKHSWSNLAAGLKKCKTPAWAKNNSTSFSTLNQTKGIWPSWAATKSQINTLWPQNS